MNPWGLLEGRGSRPGRRCGFGDGVVDLIPDKRIVWVVGKGCFQERLDAAEVEVARVDSDTKSREIGVEILPTATRAE